MSKKSCSKCKKKILLVEFYKRKSCKNGVDSKCKNCYALEQKVYRRKNKDKLAIYQIEHKFGKGAFKYKVDLLKDQDNCCAICGKHQLEFARSLALDHNHDTGKWRGLLCFSCNNKLGWFEKYPNTIINYVRKYDD